MSSRRIFEFVCSQGHRSEKLVYPETQEIYCLTCDGVAQKTVSPVRSRLDGISGDFPSAADRWARVHEEASRKANKRVEGRTQYDD